MINYKKLAKEDQKFEEFLTEFSKNVLLEVPDFRSMLAFVYTSYQIGMSTKMTVDAVKMFTKLWESDL